MSGSGAFRAENNLALELVGDDESTGGGELSSARATVAGVPQCLSEPSGHYSVLESTELQVWVFSWWDKHRRIRFKATIDIEGVVNSRQSP